MLGSLWLQDPLDYETLNQFVFEIQISDYQFVTAANVTINVLDVPEPPEVISQFVSLYCR